MNTLDQIPTRRSVPSGLALPVSRLIVPVALRLLLAAVASAAVVATAVAGMFVTSAPRWLSLILEPFSLLLFPGALFAWGEAAYNKLDFSGMTTIRVSVVLYFFIFASLLLRHLRHKIHPRGTRRARTHRSR